MNVAVERSRSSKRGGFPPRFLFRRFDDEPRGQPFGNRYSGLSEAGDSWSPDSTGSAVDRFFSNGLKRLIFERVKRRKNLWIATRSRLELIRGALVEFST